MVDDGTEANGVTDAELNGSFGHGVLARGVCMACSRLVHIATISLSALSLPHLTV